MSKDKWKKQERNHLALWRAVFCYFKGDAFETARWFRSSNPLLGNFSPEELIRLGKIKKVRRFVEISLTPDWQI